MFKNSVTMDYDDMLQQSNMRLGAAKEALAVASYNLEREQARNKQIKSQFYEAFEITNNSLV